MRIDELIGELQTRDPDSEVVTYSAKSGMVQKIVLVDIDQFEPGGKEVIVLELGEEI